MKANILGVKKEDIIMEEDISKIFIFELLFIIVF
jgi:hypothetical protein